MKSWQKAIIILESFEKCHKFVEGLRL
jgi:hypothetical protein